MRLRILPSATNDIREGYHFYEGQEKGSGKYFTDNVYGGIDALEVEAGIHSVHFGSFHRKLLQTFPFAIYYRVSGEEVGIYAVIDCRRSPAWIRKHVQRSARQP